MVKSKFIKHEDFQVNILFGKPIYRATVHNQRIRNIAINKVRDLLEELEGKDKLGRATNGFEMYKKFLDEEDKSYMLPDTFKEIKEMDTFRKENFFMVFPEFQDYDLVYDGADITEEFKRQDG